MGFGWKELAGEVCCCSLECENAIEVLPSHTCYDVLLPQGHICYQKWVFEEFCRNSLLVDTAVWIYKGLQCHDCIIQVPHSMCSRQETKAEESLCPEQGLPLSPGTALCSLGSWFTLCRAQQTAAKPLHPQCVHVWDLPQPELRLGSTEHPQCVCAQLAVPICVCWGLEDMGCACGLELVARNLVHVHQHCSATKPALGSRSRTETFVSNPLYFSWTGPM